MTELEQAAHDELVQAEAAIQAAHQRLTHAIRQAVRIGVYSPTTTEARILRYLAQKPDVVHTRAQIMSTLKLPQNSVHTTLCNIVRRGLIYQLSAYEYQFDEPILPTPYNRFSSARKLQNAMRRDQLLALLEHGPRMDYRAMGFEIYGINDARRAGNVRTLLHSLNGTYVRRTPEGWIKL